MHRVAVFMVIHWFKNRYLLSILVFFSARFVSLVLDHWLGSTIAVLLILQLAIVVIALQGHSQIAYAAAVCAALWF
ncbi:MAG: hypothetical protein P3W98_014325 [Vibrio metschnikovii]|nr:hypothetical protein [Vibrio metschnikovii]MDM7486315.1 hypothetical protein [Vibrio metschnikovii]